MQDNNVEQEVVVKEKVIGQFKPKEKFLEFIGMRGNINFIATEAFIEGKHLSGLDMDDIKFKLTICDEGTVNFDEVDTNKTTSTQRERLLDVINEKTIVPFNRKMVIPDLPFKSVKTIGDKEVNLYLSVEYTTPISKLASLFDDDEVEEVSITNDQNSKLDDLLSLFGEDESVAEILFTSETDEELARELEGESDEKTDSQKMMEASFAKMKEEKIQELKKNLDHQNIELKRFEFEKGQAEKKIETVKTDIRVLESRIDSLKPIADSNGYYFFVSERLNEKVTLEDDVAKLIFEKVSIVKSINAEAFMKLFEAGEYTIKLGIKESSLVEVTDYNALPDDIKKSLKNIGIGLDPLDKLTYVGELTWHEIVDKMIKAGFLQDAEFDKMCGSNSYFAMYGSTDSNESAEKQNEKNMIQKFDEFKEENKSESQKFDTLAKFETPTDIVILGIDDEDVNNIETFKITDDESSFEIYQNGKAKLSLSSMGFASIMTLKEYQKLYKLKGEEMVECGIVEGVVIPNFSGTIEIAALDYDGVYHTNIDLSDYIHHQFDEEAPDGCEVIVNIPDGFSIFKLNEDMSLPTAVLRDIKIDKVIK